jgi:hypothetical protein
MIAGRAEDRVGKRGFGANTYTAVVEKLVTGWVRVGDPKGSVAVWGLGEARFVSAVDEGRGCEYSRAEAAQAGQLLLVQAWEPSNRRERVSVAVSR